MDEEKKRKELGIKMLVTGIVAIVFYNLITLLNFHSLSFFRDFFGSVFSFFIATFIIYTTERRSKN